MMLLSYRTLTHRTGFPTNLQAVRFIYMLCLLSFDSFQGLFEGGKPSLLIPDDDVILPSTPRDPARRAAADALWTNQDDLLLKCLVEKYPKNWGLVADQFNSLRGAISLEQRADWECKERYRSRWLGKDRNERDFTPVVPPAQDGSSSSTSARASQSQITTRKRMASVSSTVNTTPIPAATFESRKRRRHVLIFETMRKCAKKREATQKAAGMYPSFASPIFSCLTPT
jgi:chromatin modification-related protein VID21